MSTPTDDDIRAGYVRHGELAERSHAIGTDASVDAGLRVIAGAHALIHRYFELLEHPEAPIEPFADLFADTFDLDFTMTQIATLEAFEEWATGFRNSFECFTLTVLGIAVDTEHSPTVTASIDLDFHAVDLDGERKTMSTNHIWTITDNTIKTIAVTHRT